MSPTGAIRPQPRSRPQSNDIVVEPQPNAPNLLMALHQTLRTPLPRMPTRIPLGNRQLSAKKSNLDLLQARSIGLDKTSESGEAGEPNQPERVPARPERGCCRGQGDDHGQPAMIGRAGQNNRAGTDQTYG